MTMPNVPTHAFGGTTHHAGSTGLKRETCCDPLA